MQYKRVNSIMTAYSHIPIYWYIKNYSNKLSSLQNKNLLAIIPIHQSGSYKYEYPPFPVVRYEHTNQVKNSSSSTEIYDYFIKYNYFSYKKNLYEIKKATYYRPDPKIGKHLWIWSCFGVFNFAEDPLHNESSFGN